MPLRARTYALNDADMRRGFTENEFEELVQSVRGAFA